MFKNFQKNVLAIFILFTSMSAFAIDREGISKLLSTSGLPIEIHGLMVDDSLYVVTWRNPKDFFDFVHMSIVFENPALQKEFGDFRRQDKLLLWGKVMENPSPQIHIEVSKLQLVKKYDLGTGDNHYTENFPEDLLSKTQAEFLVHNVSSEGKVVVLEYHDHIVPMFVKTEQSAWTKNLYRNDLIRASFKVQKSPEQPLHLRLDTTAAKPLELLESVVLKHKKAADVEGELVLFPKSPQVMFNVFAVLEKLPFGLQRQYTLVNFDSPDEFLKIREKLEKAWQSAPQDAVNGRNKLIHKSIRVRARGLFNVVDPGQANVQILLKSVDDIEVKF